MVASTAPSQSTWPSRLALNANETSGRSLPTATEDSPSLSKGPFSRSTSGKSRMRCVAPTVMWPSSDFAFCFRRTPHNKSRDGAREQHPR
jgi:hypothetical protein